MHDSGGSQIFPDRALLIGGRTGSEKPEEHFDITRFGFRRKAKHRDSARVKRLREFLSGDRIDFVVAIEQAVIFDAEDDFAGGAAKVIEASMHEVERADERGMPGRVRREIFPTQR